MAHTPGPWSARPDSGQIVLNGANIYSVQEICNEQGGFNPDDLRLMAAAPDLLAACVEAVSAITYLLSNDDDDPGYADTLNTLAAAIAKAEGRG